MSTPPDDSRTSLWQGKPYFIPFGVFILLTAIPVPESWVYAPFVLYPLKTILTAWLLWRYRKSYPELGFNFHWSAPLAGVLVIVLWVGLNGWYPHTDSVNFKPTTVHNNTLRMLSVFFRLAGASLVVPVMEELFFRSWLARWIINQNFSAVRVGAFTWPSLVITTTIFTVEHHHWLPAIFAGLIFHGYVIWKKRLGDAIVAHGVANLVLGVYVLRTGSWWFW